MTDDIVDTDLVAELREVMGEGFSALVDSFQADGEKRLAALEQHLAEGDAQAARQQAHSFKGSSGNVGASRVASLCLQMEHQAESGKLEQAKDTLASLREAMTDYLGAVQ